MNDTPTPETDALISVGLENADRECVPADFTRKLERERDGAREQIEVCRGIIERTVTARNSALSDLTELERERDEAREALMKIEEVFIDSDDTYEDLIKIGNIARAALGSKT